MAGIVVTTEFPDLTRLREEFKKLPSAASARYYQKALQAALEPAYQRLIQLTPIGPTGNLRAAVAKKTKRYTKTGNAIGMVGYRAAGREPANPVSGGTVKRAKDRGFHQGFIEFGAKPKAASKFSATPYQRKAHLRLGRPVRAHTVKGQNAYIQSSWNKRGPFAITKGPRGGRQELTTTNGGFFIKSRQPFRHPGVPAQYPIRKTFEQTKGVMAEILRERLTVSLQEGLDALALVPRASFSNLGLNEPG